MKTPPNWPDPAPRQPRLFPTAAGKPRVYTIHPTRPFLQTLARALLDGHLPIPGGTPRGPLDLAAVTLLLPTRRATRALQDAFLAVAPNRALLLPRVKPIADDDEDLSLLAGLTSADPTSAAGLDIPPPLGELERQLVLTRLVLQWSEKMRATPAGPDGDLAPFAASGADTPAQAASLARELARLIDMVETEAVSLACLKDLVEDDFAQHWQQTLDFLQIITRWWPAHLEAEHKLAPKDHRNRTILAEAARLRAMPPAGPMIVAGVTGSIPATVELMRAVGDLPLGAIVLPGLDLDLDEASWQAITASSSDQRPHAEHPQFGLKTLLDRLGVSRADVVALDPVAAASAPALRMKLISEAMRPSAATAGWHAFTATADRAAFASAVDDVTLIEAPSAEAEAETIALILREAAEHPGLTAALVSPDRLLARRVAIRLEAWGIRVDDSAGRPFAKTVPGTVLDLAIGAAGEGFAPAALIALLKHPLVRLGLDPFAIRRAARALELGAFRAPYLGRGLDGVLAALETGEKACSYGDEARGSRRPRAVRRLFPEDWQGARDLVARLAIAAAPLVALFATRDPLPLHTLASAHAAFAEALCAEPAPWPAADGSMPEPKPCALWQGEAGLTARTLFDGLMLDNLIAPEIAARDYPDLYRTLVATENVRPRVPVHPRLSIWGPFEARLQQPDIVILGSLNDGIWPQSADPGPWLNRPMRAKLGLPSPEEKIGFAAHDFTQLLAGPRVYLTRAEKIDGVPTVASRWLMRLKALLGGMNLSGALAPEAGGPTFLAWARSRDIATLPIRIDRPAPRPPFAMRPRKLSVSAVETWIANPYSIFASRILGLDPLPPLGTEPDAAIRGGLIHEALARFAAAYPEKLPAEIEAELLRHASAVLQEWTGHARVAAFWLPRFERFAHWFAQTEPARRNGARVKAEISGETVIGSPAHPFTLTARADRIDIAPDGLIITDYKTGSPPLAKKVFSQKAPQLLLEAAIALAGGFPGVPNLTISGVRYIRASGGEPAGEDVMIATSHAGQLAAEAIEGLNSHIAKFDDPHTPYAVTRRAQFQYDFDAFAHLARVAEWSAHAGEDTEA